MMSLKQVWECVRINMQKCRIRESTWWTKMKISPSSKYQNCWYSQGYIILQETEGPDYWLFDYDQVMMICDIIIARYFSCIYMDILAPTNEAEMSADTLYSFYTQWDLLFEEYGNDSFDVIKCWEPITQGLILDDYDPLAHASAFLHEILSSAIPCIKPHLERMVNLIRDKTSNVHQLGELHGIFRHWGHPTVDEAAGVTKVKSIAHSRRPPSAKEMRKAKAMFARQFTISFISERGRYPRVILDHMDKSSPLHHVIKNGNTSVNFYSPRYPLKHWEGVTFDKEFEFNYYEDYLQKCDDKAISPYLQDLPTIYAKESLGYDPGKPTSSRRVLLELLRKKEIDFKKICDLVQKREIPDNWKVILVHAKEREMKKEPRLFAMFVLEMRLYFGTLESNIAKTIFKYFPQQSMTLSEHELTKRLYAMGSEEQVDSYVPLFLSIDFKSWNIHWQYFSTEVIQTHLDDLFGTPGLYTYPHIFFQEAIVSISSRFNPPEFLKNQKNRALFKDYTATRKAISQVKMDLIWTNHCGGFEGIIQKLWTLVTIIMLLLLELKTGVKSYIIGQGDNQLLKVMIPLPKQSGPGTKENAVKQNQGYLTTRITSFIEELALLAGKFKLVIKEEESWVSSQVINYSKDILYQGAYLAQGLKRSSRVMADINDLYPTLTTKISSMQTTGLSIAQKSYDIWAAYFLCQTETLMMIIRETFVSLLPKVRHEKAILSWARSDMGQQFLLHGDTSCFGIPITGMLDYLYRGNPDPLTTYITMLTQNQSKCIYCKKILLWVIDGHYKVGNGDPSLLVEDPLSVNIETPQQLSTLFKNIIFKKVKEIVVNRDLRDLFNMGCEKEDNALYNYLLTFDPVYPRLIHEILRQTPTGARLQLISTFSSARTVQQMLRQEELSHFYNRIIEIETTTIRYWADVSHFIFNYIKNRDLPSDLCPSIIATQLRNVTWANTTKGRPIFGVTIPHPHHQFTINPVPGLNHTECRGQPEYIFLNAVESLSPRLVHTRGPLVPFCGHRTREKQSGKIFQIPVSSSPLAAAERMLQLAQWCLAQSENMMAFLHGQIQSRTNLPIDVLQLTSGSITSGSQVHRLNDHFTSQGVLVNNRPNVASYLYISSDNMGKYSRGSDNVNMHFQGAMLYGIVYYHLKSLYTNDQLQTNKDTTVHMHYNCITCEEYISDIRVDTDTQPPPTRVHSTNPLTYAYIENTKLTLCPDSLLFQTVSQGTPAQALASILCSKILANLGKTVWGITQKGKPLSTKISVRTIIDIGIENVMKHVAVLLYFFYYNDYDGLVHLLSIYTYEVWQDLGPACLLPEILSKLHSLSGNVYHPQLFETNQGYTKFLNRVLQKELRKIHLHKTVIPDGITFFLVHGCGISRVITIWANIIHYKTQGRVDLRETVSNINFESDTKINLPKKDSMDVLDRKIALSGNKEAQLHCWRKQPIRLSKYDPDTVATGHIRARKEEKETSLITPRVVKAIRLSNTTLAELISFPAIDRAIYNLHSISTESYSRTPARTFCDHAYHLTENLSSAYLKILQLVLLFDINVPSAAMVLGDGESSIGLMLHKKFGVPVFFNTKLDPARIIPQRGLNYLPGEFIGSPDGVRSAPLSALYGGDINDERYRQIFLSSIDKQISLVVFDGEGDHEFTHHEQVELAKSVLIIAYKVRSPVVIHKLFLNQTSAVQTIISMFNTIYTTLSLTTPTYSSHESYEVYLIAQGFSPVVEIEEIGSKITLLGSSCQAIIEAAKNQRISLYPHMIVTSVWRDLLSIGASLGFNNSLQAHLERLTDHVIIFDHPTLNDFIEEALKVGDATINREWNGLYCMSTGHQIDKATRQLMASTTSIHKSLNKYIQVVLNLRILRLLLQRDRLRDALKALPYVCIQKYDIIDKDGTVVYRYNCHMHTLKRDVLRSLWVIWGHQHISTLM